MDDYIKKHPNCKCPKSDCISGICSCNIIKRECNKLCHKGVNNNCKANVEYYEGVKKNTYKHRIPLSKTELTSNMKNHIKSLTKEKFLKLFKTVCTDIETFDLTENDVNFEDLFADMYNTNSLKNLLDNKLDKVNVVWKNDSFDCFILFKKSLFFFQITSSDDVEGKKNKDSEIKKSFEKMIDFAKFIEFKDQEKLKGSTVKYIVIHGNENFREDGELGRKSQWKIYIKKIEQKLNINYYSYLDIIHEVNNINKRTSDSDDSGSLPTSRKSIKK